MTTIVDKSGRVLIPAELRQRLGFTAGTELEIVIEGFSLLLVRAVAGPVLVRRGKRLIAKPRAEEEIDIAQVIEEERDWLPG